MSVTAYGSLVDSLKVAQYHGDEVVIRLAEMRVEQYLRTTAVQSSHCMQVKAAALSSSRPTLWD